jgi:hypothetical protein
MEQLLIGLRTEIAEQLKPHGFGCEKIAMPFLGYPAPGTESHSRAPVAGAAPGRPANVIARVFYSFLSESADSASESGIEGNAGNVGSIGNEMAVTSPDIFESRESATEMPEVACRRGPVIEPHG